MTPIYRALLYLYPVRFRRRFGDEMIELFRARHAAAAARGKVIFEGAGKCATCHTGTTFTDANSTLHPVADSMAEPESPSYAARSATKLYRTSPLKGVWQHAPYFHDGSAATLEAVVQTYNTRRSLGLAAQEIADLTQYLKSL